MLTTRGGEGGRGDGGDGESEGGKNLGKRLVIMDSERALNIL